MSIPPYATVPTLPVTSAINLDDPAQFKYLTADTLLTYCQTQLRDVDEQVHVHMVTQKTSLDDRQALGAVSSALKKYGDNGPQNDNDWKECKAAIDQAKHTMGEDDPNRIKLEKFATGLVDKYVNRDHGTPTPGSMRKPMDGGEWKSTISEVDNMVDAIRGSAELDMIQLQSLMSQRQTAVQLTTNMMSKLDQCAESLAQKV